MQHAIDPDLFAELKQCSRLRDLQRGKELHAATRKNGNELDIRVANTLVSMYGKCRSMQDARCAFDSIPRPDVVSWNALILGYAENGKDELAIEAFSRMRNERCLPDAITFLAVIKACGNLAAKEETCIVLGRKPKTQELGMIMHSHAANTCGDLRVDNTLVRMYAKCGCLVDASKVFERMQHHDVFSWNNLIFGYVENGEGDLALEIFIRMVHEGCAPNTLTIVAALKACSCLIDKPLAKQQVQVLKVAPLEKSMAVHTYAVKHNVISELCVSSTMVCLYSKCGSLVDARNVFDNMQIRDVVSWNAMIFGYADNGEGKTALELFFRMKHEGCSPNALTLVAALKACTNNAAKEISKSAKMELLELGIQLHFEAFSDGFSSANRVANMLIGMYGKCGSMVDSRKVFNGVLRRDVVSWTSLILGYADNGEGELALEMYSKMNVAPDSHTIVAALKGCSCLALKEEGKQINGKLMKIEALERGKAIHAQAAFCIQNTSVACTLVDMYRKCRSISDAVMVFEGMKHRDVITWNAMVFGYVENGEPEIAMDMFSRMQREGCTLSPLSYVAALMACTSLASKEVGKLVDGKVVKLKALERGGAVHYEANEAVYSSDIRVANTLIDMYAKCGSMVESRKVFDGIKQRDVVSWTSLILGYAETGEGSVGLDMFLQMEKDCAPDALTYVAALKACGAIGALEFGRSLHADIYARGLEKDEILPTCLVNFYGKCGCMLEAQTVFDTTLTTKNIISWNALLTGYSRQGKTKTVFDMFQRMQDENIRPDRVTFLCILTSCSHAGLVDKGKEYFEAMACKFGVVPDIEHFHCMIDILGRANELEDAMTMVQNMPFKPDAVTWKTILSSCRKWKNAHFEKIAFEGLMQLDDKNPTAYVLMANSKSHTSIYDANGIQI